MVWFYLLSGLFLGWSLGANNAANIFGTAVGTRMVKFKVAALVTGVFVILGAVISGAGASDTLGDLGAVNALAGSFTLALAAALTVTWMTRLKLPVSTSQAIVGGIIGWNLFTGSPTDFTSLTKIVSTWVASPILAAIFAIIIYQIVKFFINKTRIHVLELDIITRFSLILVGAFGAYSLGANNIANVMGVFVPAAPFKNLNVGGWFTMSGTQQLFLVGAIAIAVGIYTYSYRVMLTVGNELYKLTPITALIAVLSESLVLFIFASQRLEAWLIAHGLPPIPLVPVSSSQAVIGAVIGIGLIKGGKGINYAVLGKIASGWITTPIVAGIISFIMLFFMQNVFEREVVHATDYDLSQVVIERLAQEKIPVIPLEKLENKNFHSASQFRQTLLRYHDWDENQLNIIFKFAKKDSFFVDLSQVPEKVLKDNLSDEQYAGLKKLNGRAFGYKWQFNNALEKANAAWQPLPGRNALLYNDDLQKKKMFVYRIFKVSRQK
ncbi:MAG: inorganic phosphate transporter [Calditrichia bacterium]